MTIILLVRSIKTTSCQTYTTYMIYCVCAVSAIRGPFTTTTVDGSVPVAAALVFPPATNHQLYTVKSCRTVGRGRDVAPSPNDPQMPRNTRRTSNCPRQDDESMPSTHPGLLYKVFGELGSTVRCVAHHLRQHSYRGKWLEFYIPHVCQETTPTLPGSQHSTAQHSMQLLNTC